MAADLQTISKTPSQINLFAGLPVGTNNIYPRARAVFMDTTTITAKSALDTKVVRYTFTAPPNYAYRLDTVAISFLDGTTDPDQYNDLAYSKLVVAGVTQLEMTIESIGLYTVSAAGTHGKAWNFPSTGKFGEIFEGDSMVFTIELADDDAVNATAALDTVTYVSMLQYDIEQVLNTVVNAPQPVSVV